MSTLSDDRLRSTIICPACTTQIWVSRKYPDVAMGQMWKHIYTLHSDGSRNAAQDLLAEVREVKS